MKAITLLNPPKEFVKPSCAQITGGRFGPIRSQLSTQPAEEL